MDDEFLLHTARAVIVEVVDELPDSRLDWAKVFSRYVPMLSVPMPMKARDHSQADSGFRRLRGDGLYKSAVDEVLPDVGLISVNARVVNLGAVDGVVGRGLVLGWRGAASRTVNQLCPTGFILSRWMLADVDFEVDPLPTSSDKFATCVHPMSGGKLRVHPTFSVLFLLLRHWE